MFVTKKGLLAWLAAFIAGEIIGNLARVVFPPPPTWLFNVSAGVSIAGLCVIAAWLIQSLRVPKDTKDVMATANVAASIGVFAGYLVTL